MRSYEHRTIIFDTPKKVKTENKPKYDLERIKANNKRDLTPANAIEGVKELYPFYNGDLAIINHFLGFSSYYNSLTIELDGVSSVRKTDLTKWQTFGSRSFIPTKIKDEDRFVYLYSGMAEIIGMEEMGLSYIGLQADGINFSDIQTDKTIIVLQENDKSSRKLTKKIIKKFNSVKVIDLVKLSHEEEKKGYDLRDFINEVKSFSKAKEILEVISNYLDYTKNEIPYETVINYTGQFIPEIKIDEGVIIARTGAGKTFPFIGQENILIIVPKVMQSTVCEKETSNELMSIIFEKGAIITYDKFCGHYNSNPDFKYLIDTKEIKLIIDEAHELTSNPSKNKELIYSLNGLFMSGTLEKEFRQDLQRVKYKPSEPIIINYMLNGYLPKIDGSLVFIDNAKILKNNYPDTCVVGKTHNHNIANVHTTIEPYIFTTSSLREGISINNPNFKACMVSTNDCRYWGTKNMIQGVNRVRGEDTIKVISTPPKPQYKEEIDVQEWTEKIKE